MLGRRLWRWANIAPSFDRCLVLDEDQSNRREIVIPRQSQLSVVRLQPHIMVMEKTSQCLSYKWRAANNVHENPHSMMCLGVVYNNPMICRATSGSPHIVMDNLALPGREEVKGTNEFDSSLIR